MDFLSNNDLKMLLFPVLGPEVPPFHRGKHHSRAENGEGFWEPYIKIYSEASLEVKITSFFFKSTEGIRGFVAVHSRTREKPPIDLCV